MVGTYGLAIRHQVVRMSAANQCQQANYETLFETGGQSEMSEKPEIRYLVIRHPSLLILGGVTLSLKSETRQNEVADPGAPGSATSILHDVA